MILRIVMSIIVAGIAFTLGGPVLYYFWVSPQSNQAAAAAKEAEAEIQRFAISTSYSREDYRAWTQRNQERERRLHAILAEKRRKRTRTWQIAIVSAIVVGGATFGALSLRSRRRRIVPPTTDSPPPPPQ